MSDKITRIREETHKRMVAYCGDKIKHVTFVSDAVDEKIDKSKRKVKNKS